MDDCSTALNGTVTATTTRSNGSHVYADIVAVHGEVREKGQKTISKRVSRVGAGSCEVKSSVNEHKRASVCSRLEQQKK